MSVKQDWQRQHVIEQDAMVERFRPGVRVAYLRDNGELENAAGDVIGTYTFTGVWTQTGWESGEPYEMQSVRALIDFKTYTGRTSRNRVILHPRRERSHRP